MNQRVYLMVGWIFGLVAGAVVAPIGAHALDNAGFEQGKTSWIWRDDNASVYQLTDRTPHGRRAAEIRVDQDTPSRLRRVAYVGRPDLPTGAGYYRLRFAAATDLEAGTLSPGIYGRLPGGNSQVIVSPDHRATPRLRGDSPWQSYELVYQVQKPMERVSLQMELHYGRGRVWIDEVSVVRLDAKRGKALLEAQTPVAPKPAEAGAQLAGQPCRVLNPRVGKLYTDPSAARSYLVLNSCTPGAGSTGAAVLVDYQRDQTTVCPMPAGSGGWDIAEIEPGRLLFESLTPLHLVSVDLSEKRVIDRETVAVPSSQYAWSLDVGPGGWVYFGSYPTCHAYRYNPASGEVQDLGRMSDNEANLYVRFVAVSDDNWLLASIASAEREIVAMDLSTMQRHAVQGPEPTRLYSVGGEVYGSIFLGRNEQGDVQRRLYRFNSESITFEDPGLPDPPEGHWQSILESSTPDRMVLLATNGIYYLVQPGDSPRPVWDLGLRGGKLVGLDKQDRVLGFRGQSYFVAQPMASTITPKALTAVAPPVAIHFLAADPQGGVTGGPSFGQTLFRFDPARDLLQNTDKVVDTGGEVYDGQWIDGKFYFVSYVGGQLGVWDPAQPWDQWNGRNPQVLADYSKGDLPLIRPQGLMAVAPDGRIYAGWSAGYGKAAGGITCYDPATGESRVWPSSLIADEVSIGRIAVDDRYVYGVTSNHFNGIRPEPKDIIFWVLDPDSGQVVHRATLEGHQGRGAVVVVPETGHVWVTSDRAMHRYDPDEQAFVERVEWPAEVDAPHDVSAFTAAGDRFWVAARKTIVRVDDGAQPRATAILTADQPTISGLAAGVDGQLYFAQGTEVWSIAIKDH